MYAFIKKLMEHDNFDFGWENQKTSLRLERID